MQRLQEELSDVAERMVGEKVRFKVWYRPLKKGNPIRLRESRGRVIKMQFDYVVVEGIDIPGLYNRRMNEITFMGVNA